jgi:hypothetical protein
MEGRKTPEVVLQEVGDRINSQDGRLNIQMAQNENLNKRLLTLQSQLNCTYQKAIEKPFRFNGERDGVKIENWIFTIKQYAKAFNLTGVTAVDMAASYLDKIALQYWRTRSSGITDIEEFFKVIRDRFYPTDYIYTIRDRLDELKQKTSVREYSEKFEALLLQLPVEEYHENDMRDLYIRHLKPEVRKLVLVANPDSLQGTIELAQRIDKIVYETKKSVPRSDAMQVDAVTRTNSKIRCYRCNQFGHFQRDCKAIVDVDGKQGKDKSQQ